MAWAEVEVVNGSSAGNGYNVALSGAASASSVLNNDTQYSPSHVVNGDIYSSYGGGLWVSAGGQFDILLHSHGTKRLDAAASLKLH